MIKYLIFPFEHLLSNLLKKKRHIAAKLSKTFPETFLLGTGTKKTCGCLSEVSVVA